MAKTKKSKATPLSKESSMLVRCQTFGMSTIMKSMDGDKKGVDPFDEHYSKMGGSAKILKPPYDPLILSKMVEISDILGQCITAMATNIDGMGYELLQAKDPTEQEELPPEAETEKKELEMFLTFINDRQNITELRTELREDAESTGRCYAEIIRNAAKKITEIHRIPAHSMRLVATDKKFTEYKQSVRDSDGKFIDIPRKRRFRRYVQKTLDQKLTYFKEFGDPRDIGIEDGKENGKGGNANEVLSYHIFSTYTPYGLPRWIGGIMALLGSRKAEEVNYLFFDNKTIPPLIITVSGGALTQETLDKIDSLFTKELKGVDNFHNALLLEAVPHSTSEVLGEKVSPVKINVQPLTDYIQKDAMFTDYRKDNRSNLRSFFKLPPIYTGDTVDYTRATAFESARIAEEQVFEPERRKWDYTFNNMILANLKINHWNLHSLGVKTNDDHSIVASMGLVKEALPVAVIQEAVAELRKVPLGKVDKELYQTTLVEHESKTAAENRPAESVPVGPGDKNPDAQDPNKTPTDDNKKLDDKLRKIEKSLQLLVDNAVENGEIVIAN